MGYALIPLYALPIPLLIGCYFTLVARLTPTTSTLSVLPLVTLAAAAYSTVGILLVIHSTHAVMPTSPTDFALELAVGLLVFFFAPLSFFEASKRLSIVVPAVANSTTPIFAFLLLIVFLHAPAPALDLVALPLTFGGSLIVALGHGFRDHGGPPQAA